MEQKNLLTSFERCLKAKNLEPMTKDLYNFFHLRCGFIAHYDINGFRNTYSAPEDFLSFSKTLLEELESDVKWVSENYTDNTDSFKYDYNFKIPEVKKEMIKLLLECKESINTDCNNNLLNKLIIEREILDGRIKELGGK